MKLIVMTLFFTLTSAYAACISPEVAVSNVYGRTYVLNSTRNLQHPTYLTFHTRTKVSFGSVLDGHPAGEFSYRGNCHAEVIIEFTSFHTNETEVIFRLRPKSREFFKLKDQKAGVDEFTIVID